MMNGVSHLDLSKLSERTNPPACLARFARKFFPISLSRHDANGILQLIEPLRLLFKDEVRVCYSSENEVETLH